MFAAKKNGNLRVSNKACLQTGKQGGIMRLRFTYIILLFLLFSLADKSHTSDFEEDGRINDFCPSDCFVRGAPGVKEHEKNQGPENRASKEKMLFNAVICLADNELNRHCYLQMETAGTKLPGEGKIRRRAPKQL
jgi:hypothetical protein